MPRANRYFIPGYVWHITHRCHKKAFLLKFAQDRKSWIHWLFESRKRYGLEVLNYSVTSNHIHLLVYAGENRETIPRSLQLAAGRTAQLYNQRKNRKGAFWEDRYHATAVDTDEHFFRCMAYIDLNMVRAGVVRHPLEWPHCGYREIVDPPRRYRILARKRLARLLATPEASLADNYRARLGRHVNQLGRHDTKPADGKTEGVKQAFWTDAVAVGSAPFIDRIKQELGVAVSKRQILEAVGLLRPENRLYWELFDEITVI